MYNQPETERIILDDQGSYIGKYNIYNGHRIRTYVYLRLLATRYHTCYHTCSVEERAVSYFSNI